MSHPLYAPVGGMLVSLIVDCILHGMLMLQMYWFFVTSHEHRDHILLRVLVGVLWAADSFQIVLLCHALYYFLVLNFNKAEVLEVSVWSLDLEVAPSVLVTFAVRTFFMIRVWHLSNKNKLLVFVITVFSLAQLGIGMAMCVISFLKERFSDLPSYKTTLSLQIGSSVIADVTITAPLIYYLNRSRTGIVETNSLINKLILWSVNTALLTGVVELLQLITWVAMTDTLLFLPFHLVIAKLYTNCMLAMLNGRSDLRRTFEGHIDTPNSFLGSVVSPSHIEAEEDTPRRSAKSNGVPFFRLDTTSTVNVEAHLSGRRVFTAPASPSADIPPSSLPGVSMSRPRAWDAIIPVPRLPIHSREAGDECAIPLQHLSKKDFRGG